MGLKKVSSRVYDSALEVIRSTVSFTIKPFRNTHPEFDCQPWSYGYYEKDNQVILVMTHGDELSRGYKVHKALVIESLRNIHPLVMTAGVYKR